MLLEVWRNMAGGERRPGQHEAQWEVLHDPDELGYRPRLLHGLVRNGLGRGAENLLCPDQQQVKA